MRTQNAKPAGKNALSAQECIELAKRFDPDVNYTDVLLTLLQQMVPRPRTDKKEESSETRRLNKMALCGHASP